MKKVCLFFCLALFLTTQSLFTVNHCICSCVLLTLISNFSFVTTLELALDRFFSGYRPLFVLDHFQKNKTNKPAISEDHEYMPWDVSVSGLALNPEMKHIPRKVVRNLVPYKPAPTETEADSIETARQQQIDALLKDRQYAADVFGTDPENVKVFSFEINAKGLPKNDKASNNSNENNLIDENTEFSVFVDGELSSNPEILKSLRKVKDLLANPGAFDQVETPYIVESPASDSFGRIVYATSVKRKRKLKMNKHKLKKRRKLQRALRRRLNR